VEELLHQSEHALAPVIYWIRFLTEVIGALCVAYGSFKAGGALIRAHLKGLTRSFTGIRLDLGRYLSLALEFQLASDILSTAIAPTLTELAKLGVTAVIRTALNFFLGREIAEYRARQEEERLSSRSGGPDTATAIE